MLGCGVKPHPKYLDSLRYLCAVMLYFDVVSKVTGHQLVVPSWVAQKPLGSVDGYTLDLVLLRLAMIARGRG